MITPDDALNFIKDHHNGEIPYMFGKNEYARWMAEFANHTVTKQLQQHSVSGKQQIQWQAIESYLNKFGTGHKMFKQILLKQARDWFEREFVACATSEGGQTGE